MTNRERLLALLGFAPAANAAEAGLLDVNMNPEDEYNPSTIDTLKRVAIGMMKVLLTTADTGDQQTGYQIKYDRPSILKLIELYEEELEETGEIPVPAQPKIRGISPW